MTRAKRLRIAAEIERRGRVLPLSLWLFVYMDIDARNEGEWEVSF